MLTGKFIPILHQEDSLLQPLSKIINEFQVMLNTAELSKYYRTIVIVCNSLLFPGVVRVSVAVLLTANRTVKTVL